MEMDGAVALVTGGAGGIGAALAQRLSAAGVTVVTADLAGTGADVALDVTDAGSVEAAVDGVVQRHGRLDLVAAIAGVGVGGFVEELSLDDWQRAIDVNVWGTIHTVRAAYPRLVAAGRGHLVLMASLAGLVPTPLLVPYATSKSAVVGLGKSLRPEAARHGIGVTTVCPGPVTTPMLDTPASGASRARLDVHRYLERAAGKALSPDKIAAAIVRGVQRDRAIIAPGQAGSAWVASRLSPRAAELLITRAMKAELAAG